MLKRTPSRKITPLLTLAALTNMSHEKESPQEFSLFICQRSATFFSLHFFPRICLQTCRQDHRDHFQPLKRRLYWKVMDGVQIYHLNIHSLVEDVAWIKGHSWTKQYWFNLLHFCMIDAFQLKGWIWWKRLLLGISLPLWRRREVRSVHAGWPITFFIRSNT